MTKRSSGVLMHITSLPGEFGIGTFGKSAYDFVDFLEETKQTYWQILPLTTTSYGDSPYQSFSAVAGNLNLIDFSLLKEEGLLEESDYSNVNFGENPEKIDYALLFEVRRPILEKAVANTAKYSNVLAEIEEFEKDNSSWLADYAEYMAIKESFGYQSFIHWDEDIKKGEKAAREKYRTELQDSIRYYTVTQYFFFKQWLALKEYANGKGVKIIGDMPIYVSADSVEMWTMPELFKVDDNNEPLYVAGCPADDFSPTGQLWGNPIYDWEKHKEQGFSWWIYRVQESFKIYDVLRIDHFKGFSDFWQIDKDAENAVNGTWEAGPGIELFQKIKEQLGDLPIIAENLGFIDEKAEKLLDDSGYPGMKILQFAFPGDDNLDRPHHYTQNSVAYTGTHDNDVVNGWYEKLSESEQELVSEYLNRRNDETITEAMIRGIYSSVSDYAIVTMQDLLDKDATSRMNVPSTVGGNWEWRMLAEDLTEERKEFLKNITVRYSRERA
ncbi:4-alpha-glucanotransferase [Gemella haemolysans]|uniref:4-alpha-glucanotransferase n=1 Tax=Gemella haemolysans TaxID=1379 RepID=A0AAW6B7A7_9BACL|nr:4-alpha-glucanotransferase [Gemella haemolysans]MDB6186369.1 4-alpha-glucanotransferase [Gemella haemolysans]MDB6212358.1 4-alpha-glucanotransferase [Gemella haemolysans]MDU4713899.1 4-alpha-glucanotransferase [Gemella haemolysans]